MTEILTAEGPGSSSSSSSSSASSNEPIIMWNSSPSGIQSNFESEPDDGPPAMNSILESHDTISPSNFLLIFLMNYSQ